MDNYRAIMFLFKNRGYQCEYCKIISHCYYSFGKLKDGTKVYQDISKNIYIAETSELFSKADFTTEIIFENNYKMELVKVKMIFLNGDRSDFSLENIKLSCKRCIERIKKEYISGKRLEKREKMKILYPDGYLPYWLYIKRKKEREDEVSRSIDRDRDISDPGT